ncbi:MAG: hypothetical protein IJD39_01150 [Clostridia bacterium]|nr:hypothetical protein [Clostridia bacterium]
MQKKRDAKTGRGHRIALCGMAMALSAAVMLLGHILSFGEYFWYFVAALFVDLPKKTGDKGLCCLGSILLSSLVCGFNYVYLASYALLMAPYPVVKAALSHLPKAPGYLLTVLFWWAGLSGIMWFTPMFFVQLSAVSNVQVRLLALLGLMLLSLGIDLIYRRLHAFGKQILSKVMFRLI